MIRPDLIELVKQRRRDARYGQQSAIVERVEKAKIEISRLLDAFQSIDPALGRIVLFGSLAQGTPKRLDFDIDLSFEGREYYLCVAVCLDSPFKVDLVDYTSAAPYIRREIDTRGIVLYEP